MREVDVVIVGGGMVGASLALALAGTGLIGVAKDNLPKRGLVPALSAGFCMIELDTETGAFEIKEYIGVADCGTGLLELQQGGWAFAVVEERAAARDPKREPDQRIQHLRGIAQPG